MRGLEKLLLLILFLSITPAVFSQELGESNLAEPEYLEWGIGFIGFIAAITAAYTGIKAFGGMVGSTMKLYAIGILLIGIASITCFLLYIANIGNGSELSIQIEDTLRTIALVIFSIAGFLMYRKSKSLGKSV